MQHSDIAERGLVLLGCGKMGSAMLEGWLDGGLPPASVWVSDPNPSDWLQSQGVQINTMPQDVQDKLAKTAQKMWDEEAKRSDKAAEVVEKLKGFLSDLGYL